MDETPPTNKLPYWTWGIVAVPLVVVIALSIVKRGGESSAGGAQMSGEFAFDPAPFPGLQIKGKPTDGESSWGAMSVAAPPPRNEAALARGRELYSKACAACHGEDGSGEGPLVTKIDFNSRPANFTLPVRSIKVRTTANGTLPLSDDLFRTITRGLPGTAMLSFRELSDADRWALVYRVEEFWARDKWQAAEPVKIPTRIESDMQVLDEGRKIFTTYCQNCHGTQAMGGTALSYQPTGKPFAAVPFARSGGKYMFGGSTEQDIARTLLTGFSTSSPMMSFKALLYGDEPNAKEIELGNRKLWGTVHFTRTLIEAQKAEAK